MPYTIICATSIGATLAGLYKAVPKASSVIEIEAFAEDDATLSRASTWLNHRHSYLTILVSRCHVKFDLRLWLPIYRCPILIEGF